jgi:hypothetical protein
MNLHNLIPLIESDVRVDALVILSASTARVPDDVKEPACRIAEMSNAVKKLIVIG